MVAAARLHRPKTERPGPPAEGAITKNASPDLSAIKLHPLILPSQQTFAAVQSEERLIKTSERLFHRGGSSRKQARRHRGFCVAR